MLIRTKPKSVGIIPPTLTLVIAPKKVSMLKKGNKVVEICKINLRCLVLNRTVCRYVSSYNSFNGEIKGHYPVSKRQVFERVRCKFLQWYRAPELTAKCSSGHTVVERSESPRCIFSSKLFYHYLVSGMASS